MAYTLVAHGIFGSPDKNGFTSSSLNTTGADLLVLGGLADNASYTLTDSKGNSIATATGATTSIFGITSSIYYVKAPTVGSGHTWTLTGTSGDFAFAVLAFSGSDQTAPLDQTNGTASSFGSTVQPGSITPGQANELLVTFCIDGDDTNAFSVDSGFTIADQLLQVNGGHKGLAIAYQIQTTATARNPTWTLGSGNLFGADIASFKLASAPSFDPSVVPWMPSAPVAVGLAVVGF